MPEIPQYIPEEDCARLIVRSRFLDIRHVANGDEPFLYSSGNYGPGYINIKGLVGRQATFKTLSEQCALRLLEREAKFDFIAGNATGGMVPAYQVREDLQRISGRNIPYIYVRNTRKIGGHQEHTTGLTDNPDIPLGSRALPFEELVNFAQTTCNSATVLRQEGHEASHAGTFFTFGNPVADEQLREASLSLIWVVRLNTALEIAETDKAFPREAIDDFRTFLKDPREWMAIRGLERKELDNETRGR